MRPPRTGADLSLVLWASVALAIGVAVHLLDRGGSAHFVTDWLAHRLPPMFGVIAGSLPAIVHVLAFTLLTAAVLRPWPRLSLRAPVTWVLFDLLFEQGQHAALRGPLLGLMPASADGTRARDAIAGYLAASTFDGCDLAAIGLGGLTAYLVLNIRDKGSRP